MKKRIISIFLFAILTIFVFPFFTASANEIVTLYVAPNGDDTWEGNITSPLATIKGARDKVRKIKETSGLPKGGIRVLFREGSYQVNSTTYFYEQDSGEKNSEIVYASYNNEKVIFTGGEKISGRNFSVTTDERVPEDVRNSVYQFDLGAYMTDRGRSLSDYYPLNNDIYSFSYTGKRPIYSFDDEGALWIARYPNKSGGKYEDINPNSQFLGGTIIQNGGTSDVSTFSYTDERISNYAGREDVWFYGFPIYVFYHCDVRIGEINAENKTFTTAVPLDVNTTSVVNQSRDFIIYNILEELDSPGEYYIDKDTGIFYVYPKNDITKTNLNISLFSDDYIINMTNASFITFSGITFENTKGSALFISGGEEVNVRFCEFYNMGISAIKLGKCPSGIYTEFGDAATGGWNFSKNFNEVAGDGTKTDPQLQHDFWSQEKFSIDKTGKNHGIFGCKIRNTGMSSIEVYGGSSHRSELAGHRIENCHISFPGVTKRTYSGAITMNMAHGMTIKNNTLCHTPATVINGNTTVADISFNEIYDGLGESTDNGLIYLNYCYPALDVKINNNYFHDIPLERGGARGSQRSGIAYDNTYGGGKEFKNNYFVNIPRGMFIYTECEMDNNVFIDCEKPTQGSYDATIAENPEYYWYPFNEGKDLSDIDFVDDMAGYYAIMPGLPIFASEEVYNEWKELYPSFMNWFEIVNSQIHNGKKFFKITNNIVVNKKKTLITHSNTAYSGSFPDTLDIIDIDSSIPAMYNEAYNNLYTSDTSMFGDYENGDYRIKKAWAEKNGFEPLDLELVGAKHYKKDNYNPIESFAAEYTPEKNVNVSGIAPNGIHDNYATVMLTRGTDIIYANQAYIDADGKYEFSFKVDEDISDCVLKVRCGANAFTENMIISSDKYKVLSPKLTLKKDGNALLKMVVDNKFSIPDYSYNLIIVLYDEYDKVIGINYGEKKTALSDGVTTDSIEYEITQEQQKKLRQIKGYMWDGEIKPVCDVSVLDIKTQ